ncbi:amidase family protein [Paenibacillus humicola]|nr:amidase family protein [Paenibacillus humicola]
MTNRGAVLGLDTDTSGFVRGPANVTGLVGVRPTLGLITTPDFTINKFQP